MKMTNLQCLKEFCGTLGMRWEHYYERNKTAMDDGTIDMHDWMMKLDREPTVRNRLDLAYKFNERYNG